MILLTSAAAVAIPGIAELGRTTGAAQVFEAAPSQGGALRVSTASAGSSSLDTRGVTTLLTLFPRGSVDVTAQAAADAVPLVGATGASAVVGAVRSHDGLTLTDGAWPTDPDETAVQADAAHDAGLAVGSTATLSTTQGPLVLRVSGLWHARDPVSPRWFGGSLFSSGHDGDETGPFLISPAALDALVDDGRLDADHSWTIVPTGAGVSPADLPAVRRGLDRAADALITTHVTGSDNTNADGDLAATLSTIARADTVTRALVLTSVALVAGTGGIAVTQILGVLSLVRRREDSLLRARGADALQFVAVAAIEAAVVAVAATVIGIAVGESMVVAARASGSPGVTHGPLSTLVDAVPVAALTGAVVVMATVALACAVATTSATSGTAALRRRRPPLLVVLAVFAVAGAALSVWRLALIGQGAIDGSEADPLAPLAPVLVCVAGTLLVAVLLWPASTAVARLLGRTRGHRSVDAARQVSRRREAFAAPTLAVALVVAGTGFAASFAATSHAVDAAVGSSTVGSRSLVTTDGDLSVQPGGVVVTSPPIAATGHGIRATTALRATAAVGQQSATVVGLRARRGLPSQVADEPLLGAELPAGTRSVRLQIRSGISSTGDPGTISLVAWFSDRDGAVAAVPLRTTTEVRPATTTDGSSLPLGTTADVSAALPAGAGRWRLLALEPTLRVSTGDAAESGDAADSGMATTTTIEATRIRAARLDDGTHLADVAGSASGVLTDAGSDHRLPVGSSRAAATSAAAAPVSVVITRTLAERLDASTGSTIDVTLAATNATVPAVVKRVVDDIPGSASRTAIGLDLPGLVQRSILADEAVPRPGAVEADSESSAFASDVARTVPYPVQIRSLTQASMHPIVVAAIGAVWSAMLASALLAVIVLGAAAHGLAKSRPDDPRILRALGVRPRAQARGRLVEMLAVVVSAVMGGVVVGAAVTAVVVATFGLASVPGAVDLVVARPIFDPSAWASAVGAFCIAALVVAVVAAVASTRRPGIAP